MPITGYYSLIQYVPDSDRAEGINVAVLVFVPGAHLPLTLAMSQHPPHLRERAKGKAPNEQRLEELVRGIHRRLNQDAPSDLTTFIKSIGREAGVLRILTPRAVAIVDPQRTSVELRDRLVGEATPRSHTPKKIAAFERLLGEPGMGDRIHRGETVRIPGKLLRPSYVWNNGKPNVVVNAHFRDDNSAVDSAYQWGAKGQSLLGKPVDGTARKLALVYQMSSDVSTTVSRELQTIFSDFKVDGVPPDQLDAYITKVRQQAH